jgi:FdhD protein
MVSKRETSISDSPGSYNRRMTGKITKRYPALFIQGGRAQKVEDWVAAEVSYELYLNDTLVDTIVVSPSEIELHALGYLVTEGMAEPGEVEGVHQEEGRVFVRTNDTPLVTPSKTVWRSSAYRGVMAESIPLVSATCTVDPPLIVQCAHQIIEQAESWKKTGGVHISLLFNLEGVQIKAAEDIGRHNSVDKVVGYALLHNIPLNKTILACSGRQPEGMVLKAARARIPIVLTKAAVTDRGIEQADQLGVTLIGFARGDRFTIYTHPERVQVVFPPKLG